MMYDITLDELVFWVLVGLVVMASLCLYLICIKSVWKDTFEKDVEEQLAELRRTNEKDRKD